uniref:Uncharacterized protein n=1 Tax=Zooxanthella nutricula TaxID=1333877 RepID=A0A6U9C8G9_9DINO|mmetsp:Transcript_92863/g.284250  ORF Transcript_92863/g.284250 Transcript_92863/m.284250 type:complete len:188 (+) Transcript_92863:96-659(+)
MVRREGGARGLLHTNYSVRFCRCSPCVGRKREHLFNPENEGKTVKQMAHEGKMGINKPSRSHPGNRCFNLLPGARRLSRADLDFLELQDARAQSREYAAQAPPPTAAFSQRAVAGVGDGGDESPAVARAPALGDFLAASRAGTYARRKPDARAASGQSTPRSAATDASWVEIEASGAEVEAATPRPD